MLLFFFVSSVAVESVDELVEKHCASPHWTLELWVNITIHSTRPIGESRRMRTPSTTTATIYKSLPPPPPPQTWPNRGHRLHAKEAMHQDRNKISHTGRERRSSSYRDWQEHIINTYTNTHTHMRARTDKSDGNTTTTTTKNRRKQRRGERAQRRSGGRVVSAVVARPPAIACTGILHTSRWYNTRRLFRSNKSTALAAAAAAKAIQSWPKVYT